MSENETISGFCRDCGTVFTKSEGFCQDCQSKRIVCHKEFESLAIAHIDCDAFYAAVEKRDNPELMDKPVIVGGGQRGVVSTACYVARTFGVHSAMPMFKAKKACPDAVIIKPNMEKYSKIGREIRQLMKNLSPLVEPISIDEAFLDMSGTERVHGVHPAIALARLQSEIKEKLGISVSIGLSHNKFLAKIASDYDKPNGFFMIGRAETNTFLARQPISLIWGVGKSMSATLKKDGLTKISQLQSLDEATLTKKYGEIGLRLYKLARGIDTRPVRPHRETKSISSETTFNRDIFDQKTLEDRLWSLCDKVSARMKEKKLTGRVVTLKLKTAKFKTITRRSTLAHHSNLARTLFSSTAPLLHDSIKGQSFRLIGVGFSDLAPEHMAPQSELFEPDDAAFKEQERAIDEIRAKFGSDAIGTARSLRKRTN